jgi:CRP-like cAMP-binding protein
MAAAKTNKVDVKTLRSLEPVGNLSPDKLAELADKSSVEGLPAGRVLFRQGERDKRLIYLLSGTVELTNTGSASGKLVKAKSSAARHPLAPEQPRSSNAKTKTDCTFLYIDSDLLEILSENENSGFIEVEELSADDDSAWMVRFLQSRAFLKLPTENIQTLLMKLEEVPVSKGDVIINQGDTNDFYYIVQKGRCAVSRRPAPNSQDVQIAILRTGDGFGEEALITGGKRNANITMLEDGVLMQLGKKDFMEYLANPLVNYIDNKTVLEKASRGSLLIDVRRHDEFMADHVEGSINIPLSMLRVKIEGLNKEREFVLLCDDGHRSAAAAFLLTQHGLDCYVLKGGLGNSKLKLPSANLSVPIVNAENNKKTAVAKKAQHAAEAKADKIRKEAQTAKQEAAKLAKQAAELESAKRKADAEIKRLQQEEVAKREAALIATRQRLNEESKRAKQAEENAAKLKLEAKASKRKVEQELQRLQSESAQNEKRQKDLDSALQHAKSVATEAAKKADMARRQAEREAQEIRQLARQEAQQLRKEMEESRLRFEQEAREKQQKQAREHNARLEATHQQALNEAKKIRLEAHKEAEQLRQELESTRQQVEAQAAQLAAREQEQQQQLLDIAQRKAEELAKLKTAEAEEEAERIRQEALDEAERLREEIKSARQLLDDQVSKAQAQSKQLNNEKARKLAAAKKAKLAEQEAERQRQAHALAEQQRAEQAELERKAKQRTQQQAAKLAKEKSAEAMRHKAKIIKARLQKVEQLRQEEEARNKAEGMSLSNATIRKVGNRIILEGDQDIFIFKEPSVTPEEITSKPESVKKVVKKEKKVNELPSFNIETPAQEVYVPIARNELSETLNRHREEITAHHKQRNVRIIAIAASVLLTVGIVGSMFIFKSENKLPASASRQIDKTTQKATIAKPGIKVPTYSPEQLKQAKKLKSEAQRRFDKQLEDWKNKVALKKAKPSPTVTPTPVEQTPAIQTPTVPAETPALPDGPIPPVSEMLDTVPVPEQRAASAPEPIAAFE